MTTSATAAPSTDIPSTLPARRAMTSMAAVAAGVCIPVGHWFTVNPGLSAAAYLRELSAHQTTGVAGGLMTSVGAFLLVPGLVALLSLAPGRGARLATSGAILAGCGAVALGA